MEYFPDGKPRREDLDTVTGGKPAFLFNRDVHGAWVNSAALALAGIDASTPDPPDGRYERDADGTPTGLLHEGAAYSFETRWLPVPSRGRVGAGDPHRRRRTCTRWGSPAGRTPG